MLEINYAKRRARENYELSSMIAAMVGASMNGKKVPTLYDTYPKLFAKEKEEQDYLNFRNALLTKAKKEG